MYDLLDRTDLSDLDSSAESPECYDGLSVQLSLKECHRVSEMDSRSFCGS